MTHRSLLLVGFLLALFSVLTCTLLTYDARQRALGQEGNHLLSAEAITVTGNARDIVDTLGADVRVFRALEDNGAVRAVLASSGTELSFPVHAGRAFRAADSRVALVGAQVPVTTESGSTTVTYDGERYEVIGRLGVKADSLLAVDILLLDPERFAASGEEPLTVDGSHIRDRFAAAFGPEGIEAVSTAVNKRTNIDVISPLILGLGSTLIVLGWVFTGLLARSRTRARTRVLILLGATRRRRLGLPATQILGLSALTLIAAGCLTATLSTDPVPTASLLVVFVSQSTVILGLALIGAPRVLRNSDD